MGGTAPAAGRRGKPAAGESPRVTNLNLAVSVRIVLQNPDKSTADDPGATRAGRRGGRRRRIPGSGRSGPTARARRRHPAGIGLRSRPPAPPRCGRGDAEGLLVRCCRGGSVGPARRHGRDGVRTGARGWSPACLTPRPPAGWPTRASPPTR